MKKEKNTTKRKFSINNLTVKRKITLFSAIMLILMITISAVGFWASSNINKARSSRYDYYGRGEYYLSEAYSDFADVKVRLRNILYIYYDNTDKLEDQINQMDSYAASVTENLGEFEKRLEHFDDEIADQYDDVVDNMNAYIESANESAQLAKSGKVEQGREELISVGIDTANAVESELMELIGAMEQASEDNNALVEKELAGMQSIMLGVTVVAFVITLAYAFTLIRGITVPVKKLSEAAQKLALGDVDVDCEKIYDDDLGDLMDNFADMAAGIREQVRIADIIARGDFTVDVKPRSEQDVLGKALLKLVTDENATLNNIREAGAQITVGSEQVASASQALAQGSTQQASAVQEVTASIDEVTERTRDNATEAGQASTLVNNVKEMAASGNEQMKAMIEAMDGINQSSETISKIIKTIDDISFQTNILALNATVEAARAGVHGKGFAVVAEEVRNLAAKSASAAGETAEMIEDSIHKVANGTKIAEETAKSLDEIVKAIDEIVVLISNIKVSSNDQATSISQIDQALAQVSTVVQTNAATSQQCAAASEELSNQAVTLKELIGQYKLHNLSQGSLNTYTSSSVDMVPEDNEQIISLDGDFSKY